MAQKSLLDYIDDNELGVSNKMTETATAVVRCGDALEELRKLQEGKFQLIVSSPPYNLGKSYEKKQKIDEYIENYRRIIQELYRVCHNEGGVVWQVGNCVEKGEVFPLDIYFYPLFLEAGFKLRNRVIWHFGHGLHASKRFSGRYETALWFTKSDDYVFNLDAVRVPSKYPGKRHYKGEKAGLPSGNPLGKNPSDFWDFLANEWEDGVLEIPNVKSNHPEKTIHPCQFPIELVERFILALTNENDWILDPYGGVGSSLIAALKNKRKGLIIDKELQYLKIAEQRVRDLNNGSLKYRKLGTPVYQPTGREAVSKIPQEWIKGRAQ